MDAAVETMLRARPVAVVGASADRSKYGNIVLRTLRARGWPVYAVNPKGGTIEGEPAWRSLADLPQRPELAVIVTPPEVSEQIVAEAHAAGIRRLWFQPGAESEAALREARRLGLETVAHACIMVLAAQLDAQR